MKTTRRYIRTASRMGVMALGLMVISLLFSGCDEGRDGRPGRAYLSLEYQVDRPDYINAGTPDIPAVFEWGRPYRAYAGWYTLYYEGRIWNGFSYAYYAWEIDYEIWYESGSRGGYSYDGRDGMDNYFSLVCSPYGPIVDRYTSKSLPAIEGRTITAMEDGSFEVLYSTGEMGMKAIYRPVEVRSSRK